LTAPLTVEQALRELDRLATAEAARRDGTATLARRAQLVGADPANWTRCLSGKRQVGWATVVDCVQHWNSTRNDEMPPIELVVGASVEFVVGAAPS
jgi:hypothetical protein